MIKIKEKYVRWAGIPILGITICFFFIDEDHTWYRALFDSIFFTFIFWQGSYYLMMFWRRRYPTIEQTVTRLMWSVLSISLYILIADYTTRFFLFGELNASNWNDPSVIFSHMDTNFIATLVVISIYESVYFFSKWKQTVMEAEALKNQQLRTQLEVLKNQMSPHFLFNSLNTLTTLIAENPEIAIEFTQKLSEVFRYILQNKEKELVRLRTEMEFVRSYVYLLQMRYPNNLTVNYKVDERYMEDYIAPLTLQMLVENSIKHNVISRANPLTIDIYVESGQSIVVKNNLQRKKVSGSTRLGLENIRKRYQFLNDRQIDIVTTAEKFMVAIPLIKHLEIHGDPLSVSV